MSWFSRLFRSRAEAMAEKAEVEGRFDDAARLYAEMGARAEAFRVLVRAAEASRELSLRRGYYTRAYSVARTDEAQAVARKGLALATLGEFELAPPRNEVQRARLSEAAVDLERLAAHREAARAFKLLGDREGLERCMMLAGDIEGFEREVGAEHLAEKQRLRRRNAVETCEALWRSGDRLGGLAALEAWLRAQGDDSEVRLLLDERRVALLTGRRIELRFGASLVTCVGSLPVSLGREGAVPLRGAGVSREHAVLEAGEGAAVLVRDNGSRNGTTLGGLPLAGALPLAEGQVLGLGADLALRVRAHDADATVLEVDRGMDRGRRLVLLRGRFATPAGALTFDEGGHAVLAPSGPVHLNGQRVVMPVVLARGDRIEGGEAPVEVLR